MTLSKERKRLLLSVLVIAIAVSLIGAGTYAYFSATVSTTTINFTAGTIDLAVNGSSVWDVTNYNTTLGDLKPCQKAWINVTVKNNGTNPFYAFLKVCNISNDDYLHPYSENGEDQSGIKNMIEDVIIFDLYNGTNALITDASGIVINHWADSPQNWSTKSMACNYTALNLTGSGWYAWAPGQTNSLNMSFMMACNTTNWAQGDRVNLTLTLFAVQSEGWENAPGGQFDPSLVGITNLVVP